jgi:hypothetical protein
MILVGERGAEDRLDSVPHDIADRAFVSVHGFHHTFEDRVEEFPCVFRIEVFKQFGRAFHIGEEDGDLLAFPFQSMPGAQDPFGEMFRNIRLG